MDISLSPQNPLASCGDTSSTGVGVTWRDWQNNSAHHAISKAVCRVNKLKCVRSVIPRSESDPLANRLDPVLPLPIHAGLLNQACRRLRDRIHQTPPAADQGHASGDKSLRVTAWSSTHCGGSEVVTRRRPRPALQHRVRGVPAQTLLPGLLPVRPPHRGVSESNREAAGAVAWSW
jgi:hypothetical protein